MATQPFNKPRAVFDINAPDVVLDHSGALTSGLVFPYHHEDNVQFAQSSLSEESSWDGSGLNADLSTTPLTSDASIHPQNIVPVTSLDSVGLTSPSVRGNHQECPCVTCLQKRCIFLSRNICVRPFIPGIPLICPVPECILASPSEFSDAWYHSYEGFPLHFKQGPERFICILSGCGHISKRWSDLQRHSRTHCIDGPQYPCPEFGCSRGGDSGFHRKDKLQDHRRKVHQGNVAPRRSGQPLRPLKAKAQN